MVACLLYLSLLGCGLVGIAHTTGSRSISVLCSSIEELCRDWAQGFTERTGIDVVMVRLSTGEALARLSRPGGLGEFDVWHGGPADSYVTAASRGLLATYHSPEAGAVPTRYRDAAGRWTGVYMGVLGFCSNTRVLHRIGVAVPTSWNDLLDPRLRHLVSVPNPLSSGTGYTTIWTQRYRLGSDQAALAYLKGLHANVLQYTNSGLAPAGIAARGEAAVAVTFSQHCAQAIDQGSSDLVISYPAEGTGFEIGSVALLNGATDVAAAREYVDYAISRDGQLAGARTWPAQLPTRGDIDPDPRLGSRGNLLGYTPAEAAAQQARWTSLVVDKVLQ